MTGAKAADGRGIRPQTDLREERGYQLGFAAASTAMFDVVGRERKAKTMVAVLTEHFGANLGAKNLLNVGGSTGIIDNLLADHVASVAGIDIDAPAIAHARARFAKPNLSFLVADALALPFSASSFDVVVCSQVNEHVPDAQRMIDEIFRVLAPSGVSYFAASNRIRWLEPHYGLPLLSVVPRTLAHRYVRWLGRADRYHELHFTYWGLKRLVRRFRLHDYTARMIGDPRRYAIDYMVPPGSLKAVGARAVTRFLLPFAPGFIWLLEKPATEPAR